MELREGSYLRPLGVPDDPLLMHWEHICLCSSPGLWREMLEGKRQAGQAAPLPRLSALNRLLPLTLWPRLWAYAGPKGQDSFFP